MAENSDANAKPILSAEDKQKLIEKLLEETKQRWLADSSLGILCCTEDRPVS